MPRHQCATCPWKVSTDPRQILNGYSETQHRALSSTIAKPADPAALAFTELRIMTCHETRERPCVGWLINQLGPGNNLALRLAVMMRWLDADVQIVGEQHPSLEDTFPDDEPDDDAPESYLTPERCAEGGAWVCQVDDHLLDCSQYEDQPLPF